MHKRGVGYRLGASQVYTKSQEKPVVEFMLRARQEHADAIWIVSTHESENEARFEEYVLSLKYGIPTIPFVARKGGSVNGLVHDERYIQRIFSSFDTTTSASRLLECVGLSIRHPHFRPRSRSSNRHHVVITLCGDRRGATPMHRISLVGTDVAARNALEVAGLSVHASGHSDASWRHETANASMASIQKSAEQISGMLDADIIRHARLGKNDPERPGSNSLPFTSAASVRPGMVLFDADGGYDLVESVEVVPLDAPVYDFNIEGTHNFVANGIVTHNSIYGWRGANPEVVRDFERDFPDARVIVLEQNYRSTQPILDAARQVVQHNLVAQRQAALDGEAGRRPHHRPRGV